MNAGSSKQVAIRSLLLLGLLAAGCATHETRVERDVAPEGGETIRTEETVTNETPSPGCSGVISCTVDFTGDVIAFPFRLIGGAVTALF